MHSLPVIAVTTSTSRMPSPKPASFIAYGIAAQTHHNIHRNCVAPPHRRAKIYAARSEAAGRRQIDSRCAASISAARARPSSAANPPASAAAVDTNHLTRRPGNMILVLATVTNTMHDALCTTLNLFKNLRLRIVCIMFLCKTLA